MKKPAFFLHLDERDGCRLRFMRGSENGELSEALVPTFPARSWLSKLHGGLWRKGEFSALMERKMHLYSFGARDSLDS